MALLSFTPTADMRLTAAESEVALAAARGLSNAQIARARGTSGGSVANQVAAIREKAAVSSRTELAVRIRAFDLG